MLVFKVDTVTCDLAFDTGEVIVVTGSRHPVTGAMIEGAAFCLSPHQALLLSAHLRKEAACIIAAVPPPNAVITEIRKAAAGRTHVPSEGDREFNKIAHSLQSIAIADKFQRDPKAGS